MDMLDAGEEEASCFTCSSRSCSSRRFRRESGSSRFRFRVSVQLLSQNTPRHSSCFATAPCALLSFHRRDSPEMAEAIQQLVLDTLDKEGTIKDTRTLVLPGYKEPAATHDSQIIILGALNSLSSRDVKIISCTAVYSSINRCLSDDLLYHPRNSFSCPYSRGCSDSSSRFS